MMTQLKEGLKAPVFRGKDQEGKKAGTPPAKPGMQMEGQKEAAPAAMPPGHKH